MKHVTAVLIALFALHIPRVLAQDPGIMLSNTPGWHKIGEVRANFKMENESIVVIGADKFKSILLKVTDAPINIEKVQVFYESGEVQDVEVQNELKAGAETRVIDLRPDEELKKIVFTYKTLPNRTDEKAHVELYGFNKKD